MKWASILQLKLGHTEHLYRTQSKLQTMVFACHMQPRKSVDTGIMFFSTDELVKCSEVLWGDVEVPGAGFQVTVYFAAASAEAAPEASLGTFIWMA